MLLINDKSLGDVCMIIDNIMCCVNISESINIKMYGCSQYV